MRLVRQAVFLAITGIWLLGFAHSAAATPLLYSISGNATGVIGVTPFTNVLVTVSLIGDTANTVPVPSFPTARALVGNASVNIAGVGTATITDPTAVYSTVVPVLIDTGFPVLPYVIIGTLDSPPSVDDFTGIGAVGSAALAGYDLTTPIGPITASPGGVGYPTGLFVHTSRGNLTFSANFAPTTTGTFSATRVPEPSSLLSLCMGVALVCARGRTLRNRQ